MKTFKQFIVEEYSRACLMCTFQPVDSVRIIQDTVPKDSLADVTEENGDIVDGMQIHLHSTVLYGLENDVDLGVLVPMLTNYRGAMLNVTGVDHFENDLNVCVLRVESMIEKLHHELRDTFNVNLTHKDYKQHITLAYLKKDHLYTGIVEPFQLRLKDFIFSNSDGVHKIL